MAATLACGAQDGAVSAQVALVRQAANKQSDSSGVVVWLVPLHAPPSPYSFPTENKPFRLVQQNKTFEPHLLVVPAGAVVEFPNHDPFFHNVFSLFEGKRFDLGLYEAGSTRSVRFDRPGISYIFCNIHSQMSAVVIALDTSYYAVSERNGAVTIPHVPLGRYTLRAWYEGTSPESLKKLRREVVVGEGPNPLGTLRVVEDKVAVAHKNKYGRDYDSPEPHNPVYRQP